jgi:signal transduction histidine kinase
MKDTLSDFAALLARCHDGIAAIVRRATDPAEWLDPLVKLLGQLTPQASWTACLLRGEGFAYFTLTPANAPPHADCTRFMWSQLSSFDASTDGVVALSAEALPGYRVVVSPIGLADCPHGLLALGFASALPTEETAQAEALLRTAASWVALEGRVQTLQRERDEFERFALLGQSFAGFSHELNNALNSMMLQTSVVQLRVDPTTRQELSAIRQHGAQAAGLLRSLQHLVQERREQFYPVDLNSVLLELLEEDEELRRRVSPSLSANAPRMQGMRSAIKQLVRLLLEGVCAGSKAPVNAATTDAQDGVSFTLAFADTSLGDAEDAMLLETMLWHNLDEIGRQAGQSLVRQLDAVLMAERTGEDTLTLRLVWN